MTVEALENDIFHQVGGNVEIPKSAGRVNHTYPLHNQTLKSVP